MYSELNDEARQIFLEAKSEFNLDVYEPEKTAITKPDETIKQSPEVIEIDSDSSDDVKSEATGSSETREKRKANEKTEIIQTEKMHCVAGPSKVCCRAFALVRF